ncbi:hypothetical protein A2635_03355 [Candidatus Peribacteria bacterium RIFCSPHIGHO2_01_FULL_51_9]|nr:MAG: hypothetical protein A2635_03355 [Candidatus Peribacteria bacterium RIFCSPHIGHO2_01_FULL_51_9]
MEFETVSLIKKEDPKRSADAVANEFLEQEASDWFRCFYELSRRKGVNLRSIKMPWKRNEIVSHLPTDLITYFVFRIDPSITHEIAEVIMDGRVHLVLILAREEFPQEDWIRNISKIPIGTYQRIGNILLPPEDDDRKRTADALVHLHEMKGYSLRDMKNLIDQLVECKKKDENI